MSPQRARFTIGESGEIITIPETIEAEPEAGPSLQERIEATTSVSEEPKDDLADLFTVPQPEDNDMVTDHLTEIDGPEEDDMSDLTEVSREDIMGERFGGEPASEESQKPRYRITRPGRRIIRREPPPTSLGGLR